VTGFILIGGIGLLIVVLSLLLADLFEGIFDALSIDTGSGLFSAPVIGAFLSAFGFGAALIDSGADAGTPVAVAGGLAAGVVMGAAALWMTKSLMNMRTDEPVRMGDLVGKPASVVTRIPGEFGSYGEISLTHLGQRMKLNARAADPIPAGTAVVITEVTSASSVLVEPESKFWGTHELGGS
jgi:membrane protein implicated in regulation of membrane protease activity